MHFTIVHILLIRTLKLKNKNVEKFNTCTNYGLSKILLGLEGPFKILYVQCLCSYV
jgi:hypothetical protein